MTELCKRLKQQNLEQRLRKQNDKKEQTAKRQRHTHIISTLSLSLSLSRSLCLSFSLSLSLSLSLSFTLAEYIQKVHLSKTHHQGDREKERERLSGAQGKGEFQILGFPKLPIIHFSRMCVCVCVFLLITLKVCMY